MIDNNLNNLDPEFKKRLEWMLYDAKVEKINCYVFEWRRSLERQYQLFGQWRTVAQLKKYGVPIQYANPTAKVVTWTLQSNHLTWKSADIVFDISKDPKVRKPSWNWNYKRLIELATLHWIRNLAPKELCHFEM